MIFPFQNSLKALLSLAAPASCASCGKGLFAAADTLCERCRAELEIFSDPRCLKCGRSLPPGAARICRECRSARRKVSFIMACGPYRGVLRECILALKSRGFTAVAAELGVLMAELLKRDGRCDGKWSLVPVPLSPLSKRNRGYNQAELLAAEVAARTSLPLSSRALRKVRETARQSDLSRVYRLRNVKRAFEADEEAVFGKSILLVDDVVTTGATVEACAEALKAKGAARVAVLAAAFTLPDNGPGRNA